MKKKDFCLCENKGTDELRSNCEADQRLCFRYTDSKIPLLHIAKISSFQLPGWFMSDLVINPNCWFSHAEALMIILEILEKLVCTYITYGFDSNSHVLGFFYLHLVF